MKFKINTARSEKTGNIVIIGYNITNVRLSNVQEFLIQSLQLKKEATVTTISSSVARSNEETNDNIRFNAPKTL